MPTDENLNPIRLCSPCGRFHRRGEYCGSILRGQSWFAVWLGSWVAGQAEQAGIVLEDESVLPWLTVERLRDRANLHGPYSEAEARRVVDKLRDIQDNLAELTRLAQESEGGYK